MKYFSKILPVLSLLFVLVFTPSITLAQEESFQDGEIAQEEILVVKAKVLEILDQREEIFPGTSTPVQVQEIKVQILDGKYENKTVEFTNDYVQLEKEEVFYLVHSTGEDGREFYTVYDPNRLPMLTLLSVIFIILVIFFGGIQGLRGLISLAGSMLVIVFVLLPAIMQGYSPLLVSIGVSSLIIILGSYITHGFNKTTSSAVAGMIITVVITGLMAYFAVYNSNLTGVTNDETVFLNFNTSGGIDLLGLLMGGIMIGLLGVLYDSSISQSIAVEELHRVAPHLGRRKIYNRAIRIGREHIGALVDTLAIAYVGASLPLLLLFYSSTDISFLMIMNREVFATEIIRILIGSIGLILAVPITTLLAVIMLIKKDESIVDKNILEKEEEQIKHVGHSH